MQNLMIRSLNVGNFPSGRSVPCDVEVAFLSLRPLWHPTNHSWDHCRWSLALLCFDWMVVSPVAVNGRSRWCCADLCNVTVEGSLCGFMCCCIFYSIRIFGKLWPLQQVNDVGNFFLLLILFLPPPMLVWVCDKLEPPLGCFYISVLNVVAALLFSCILQTVYTSGL